MFFFSEDNRRIWHYTLPCFPRISRLVSPPPSPTKRRMDGTFTQTERATRVYRVVHAEVVDTDSSGSKWELRNVRVQNRVPFSDQATQNDLPTLKDSGTQVEALPSRKSLARNEPSPMVFSGPRDNQISRREDREHCRRSRSQGRRHNEPEYRNSRREEAPDHHRVHRIGVSGASVATARELCYYQTALVRATNKYTKNNYTL